MASAARTMIDNPSVTRTTENNERPCIGRSRNRSDTSATTTMIMTDITSLMPQGRLSGPDTTRKPDAITRSPWAKLNTPDPLKTITKPRAIRA